MKIPLSRTIHQIVLSRQAASQMNRNGWHFSDKRASAVINEICEWAEFYLPIDMRGKVVLDVGAGEGETAKFFLERGAKKVIAIERNKKCFQNLMKNASKFPIEPILRDFKVEDLLRRDVDFAKVDIEGYEEALLPYKFKIPVVIEVHGLQLRDKFKALGYNIEEHNNEEFDCCSYAYWKCSKANSK